MIDSKLNGAELGLARQMQPSRNGHLWNVIYSVKIFVKHDSLTQRGEGECITLPIKVMAKPDESLNKDTQSLQEPLTALTLTNASAHEYYTRYVKQWQE